ncbi:hypothetical protein LME02_06390 [Leuconostoc mesenteroides subsp. dextranicum]|nr:hypothetical protein LME02_06390 [Leuconostoc mesenteroides subsp. dextranicum]
MNNVSQNKYTNDFLVVLLYLKQTIILDIIMLQALNYNGNAVPGHASSVKCFFFFKIRGIRE